jgi:hypothetical protein
MVSPGLRFVTGIESLAGLAVQVRTGGGPVTKTARTRSKPAGCRRLAACRLVHGQPDPVDDEVSRGWDAASVKSMASGTSIAEAAEIALTASAFRS